MINDLIFVLKFYKRLNPRCLMVIENPANYLQKMEYNEIFEKEGDDELSLKRVTVSYCMLSEENKLPRKDTHLWTNSKNLHHICRNDALRCYDEWCSRVGVVLVRKCARHQGGPSGACRAYMYMYSASCYRSWVGFLRLSCCWCRCPGRPLM